MTVAVAVVLVAFGLASVVGVSVAVRMLLLLLPVTVTVPLLLRVIGGAFGLAAVVRVSVAVRVLLFLSVTVAVGLVLGVVRGARHAVVRVRVRSRVVGFNRRLLVHHDSCVRSLRGGDVGPECVCRRDGAVELQGDRDGCDATADVHAVHVPWGVCDLDRGAGEGCGHHVDVRGSRRDVDGVVGDGGREGWGEGHGCLLEALGLGVVHLAAIGEGDLGVNLCGEELEDRGGNGCQRAIETAGRAYPGLEPGNGDEDARSGS